MDANLWPDKLKVVLNLINIWVLLYRNMMSRTPLTDSECELFAKNCTVFGKLWDSLNLSQTPYGEPSYHALHAACLNM